MSLVANFMARFFCTLCTLFAQPPQAPFINFTLRLSKFRVRKCDFYRVVGVAAKGLAKVLDLHLDFPIESAISRILSSSSFRPSSLKPLKG